MEGVSAFVDRAGLDALVETCTIISEIKIGDKYLLEYLAKAPEGAVVLGPKIKAPKPRPMETNVPIAAAVTAYSRMIINGHKLEALNLGLTSFLRGYTFKGKISNRKKRERVTQENHPSGKKE